MQDIKNVALNAAVAVVTIAAVLMVGIRVKQSFLSSGPNIGSPQPRRIANWHEFVNAGHRLGPASARVTIVEFTDFQCPFCRKATSDLWAIRRRFPNDVAIVVRHFPISGHEYGVAAAVAAECAARQGRFQRYHDLLFEKQASIGRTTWTQFAQEAGVSNLVAFDTCLSDPAIAEIVRQDMAAGRRLDVKGTPTFLINDLQVFGYPPNGGLAQFVQSALDSANR